MNEGVITINIDMSNFNRMFSMLAKVVPEDSTQFVRDETARLSEECATQLSFRRSENKGGLNRDIRSVFAPLPTNAFTDPKKINGHGMKWLASGPNYLTGVKPLRYHVSDSVEDMYHLFYKSKGTLPVARRIEIGVHGKGSKRWNFKSGSKSIQHVFEQQRLIVKRGNYSRFKTLLKQRIGRLEASFALTAKILRGRSAKVKAYISRHLNGEPLPNITELAGLSNTAKPSISFGSYAPGVEGFEPQIQAALDYRAEKMLRRMELIANGYAKDISSNLPPRNRVATTAIID